jgi:uncharacterized membrane protein YeaQ/YmgE (transglycosylase-associated protein family)
VAEGKAAGVPEAGSCPQLPRHHNHWRREPPTVCDLHLHRHIDCVYDSFGRVPAVPLFHFGGKAVHILGWIVFGLIAGAIARLLMPGRQPMGLILTTILGIVGSFVGGAIGNMFGSGSLMDPTPSGWIGSIVGAFLILLVISMVSNRRTTV